MRIERRDGEDLGLVALLDEAEARALSRSLDAMPAWMAGRPSEARGVLGPAREAGACVAASFRDEGALTAFLARFLPGKLRGAGLAAA